MNQHQGARRLPRLSDLTLADVPPQIGVFPLSGALLLPRGKLPLNVFEPRYVALLEDALSTNRLIGMIQPREDETDDENIDCPALFQVGSVGRITSVTERQDGTYALTLTGICRFRLLRESGMCSGYRLARIDASAYAADFVEADQPPFDRERLMQSLRRYFQSRGLTARWSVLEELDDEALLITLPMLAPLPPVEKQLLLEARSLADRAQALQMLLDMAGPDGGRSSPPAS